MIIYLITNELNNYVYIGQTTEELERRWKRHCKHNDCPYLHNAIKFYGEENFSKKVLAIANSIEELNSLEEFWIDFYDSTDRDKGYNLRSGGLNNLHSQETKDKISNSLKGHTTTQETRDKISIACKGKTGRKGYKHTEEAKQKMSDAKKGRKLTPEHIARIVEANLGRHHTDEAKEKISKGHKGKIVSEETKEKLRNQVYTEERNKQISFKLMGNKNGKGRKAGYKHTEETKLKIKKTKAEKKKRLLELN